MGIPPREILDDARDGDDSSHLKRDMAMVLKCTARGNQPNGRRDTLHPPTKDSPYDPNRPLRVLG
jgi:hypothetical protein